MLFDQIIQLYNIAFTAVGLVISVFRYIRHPHRAWACTIVFLLGNLLSNYYWGAYVLLMGDYPNISSVMAYLGWNLSYIPLIPLLLCLRSDAEKRFFSPLALLPIPLNIGQFILYIPFGGIYNNIWQGVFCTIVAALSINSIVFYLKNRENGAQKPYVSFVLFFYIIIEYTMWTSSCFDWPNAWLYPYNYAVILWTATCVSLPWAVIRDLHEERREASAPALARYHTFIQSAYLALVLVCCLGGYCLAVWIQRVLRAGMVSGEASDPYSIIIVVLFITSWVLVVFTISIILVVWFGQKAAERDRFREAKIIAEHSNAAKSAFLANMSHEIRTPINAILGMNEIILRESLQGRNELPEERGSIRAMFADICNYAGNIESAGNNLLYIINDILDFSKIEAGKLEIVQSAYKLSSVLNDVSNMIAFKAKEKGLDFRVDVDHSLPDGLYGDEVRVRQIFTNVLNNAVKYTEKGTIRFSVGHEGADAQEEDILLVVQVQDTGIGIRPEDMDKLFMKFQRVDLERNSTVEGTGLGLAITQNLLDRMGGSIQVESVYGEGSSFIIRLPQKVTSEDPVGDFQEKFEMSIRDTKTYSESFRAPGARILIVDDTRMNLTVAVGLLKKTGLQIDTAISGAEAIELSKVTHYDLILMDQRMPGMDGTEALRHIREQARSLNGDTPVICLTADAVIGARKRYIAEGFTDYLTKPIDSHMLEQLLMKYLPEEKVTRMRDDESQAGEAVDMEVNGTESGRWSPLYAAEIDPAIGLSYCQNDESLYRSALEAYASEEEGKAQQLRQFYGEKDWLNYSILIHTIKSSSRMIGANGLSDTAARLEAAADEGRENDIAAEHESMLNVYHKTAGAIFTICEIDGNHTETGITGPDEEILEFMPDMK